MASESLRWRQISRPFSNVTRLNTVFLNLASAARKSHDSGADSFEFRPDRLSRHTLLGLMVLAACFWAACFWAACLWGSGTTAACHMPRTSSSSAGAVLLCGSHSGQLTAGPHDPSVADITPPIRPVESSAQRSPISLLNALKRASAGVRRAPSGEFGPHAIPVSGRPSLYLLGILLRT